MRVWQREKRFGFTLYLYGDIVIHEAKREHYHKARFGYKAGVSRVRYWRVYHAKTHAPIGEQHGYARLKDAKAAANEFMDRCRAEENAQWPRS